MLFVAPSGELMRGSARSVEGVNITAKIRREAALLSSFGGHPMAAGLSLDPQNFTQFQRDLDRSVEEEIIHPSDYARITDRCLAATLCGRFRSPSGN